MGIKTKTVCVKKQRKVSSKVDVSSDETHDILIDDNGTEDNHDGGNVISMESMVCLPDPSLTPIYHDAIKKLKSGHYKTAEESLLKIVRYHRIIFVEIYTRYNNHHLIIL